MKSSQFPEILDGKMILIVDDERDVLDVLKGLLDMCKLDVASSFEDARELLETKYYDIVVLDIMGVRGYDLLEIANRRNIPALMLTAHALSEEHLKKSAEMGASSYIPKEEIANIATYIADVLEAREMNTNSWLRWFDRLSTFFDKKFGGTDWREKEKQFWEEKRKGLHWR
jgi:DNA-binding NtrC family response regulator